MILSEDCLSNYIAKYIYAVIKVINCIIKMFNVYNYNFLLIIRYRKKMKILYKSPPPPSPHTHKYNNYTLKVLSTMIIVFKLLTKIVILLLKISYFVQI